MRFREIAAAAEIGDADLVEVLCRSRLFRDVARAEIERMESAKRRRVNSQMSDQE